MNHQAIANCFPERLEQKKMLKRSVQELSDYDKFQNPLEIDSYISMNKNTLFWDWILIKYKTSFLSLMSSDYKEQFENKLYDNIILQNMSENEIIDKL